MVLVCFRKGADHLITNGKIINQVVLHEDYLSHLRKRGLNPETDWEGNDRQQELRAEMQNGLVGKLLAEKSGDVGSVFIFSTNLIYAFRQTTTPLLPL